MNGIMKSAVLMMLVLLHAPPVLTVPPSLQNCGNTCFLNASLQLLLNISPLTDTLAPLLNLVPTEEQATEGQIIVMPQPPVTNYYTHPLITSYLEILRTVLHTKKGHASFNCDHPLSTFVTSAYRVIGAQQCSQQDADEFLGTFLAILFSEIRAASREINKIRSLLTSSFYADLVSVISCPGNPPVTNDEPGGYGLPVSAEDEGGRLIGSLQECLAHFFKKEKLEGYVAYGKKRDDCTKQFQFREFPQVLIITLKRYSQRTGIIQKLSHPIEIPLVLDMTNYGTSRPGIAYLYELTGVAVQGGSLLGGHYWAYVKGPNQNWYRCDDSAITELGKNLSVENMKEIDGGGSATGYLFVYEKTTIPTSALKEITPPKPQPQPERQPGLVHALEGLQGALTTLGKAIAGK